MRFAELTDILSARTRFFGALSPVLTGHWNWPLELLF
jgi:hypothetical protein